jgi:hypothetical protein
VQKMLNRHVSNQQRLGSRFESAQLNRLAASLKTLLTVLGHGVRSHIWESDMTTD